MPKHCQLVSGICRAKADDPLVASSFDDFEPVLSDNCASFNTQSKLHLCEATDETRPNYCEWRSGTCRAIPASKMWPETDEPYEMNASQHNEFDENCKKVTDEDKCKAVCDQATEVMNEAGECVPKPWGDWMSCSEEVRQGACPGGADPSRPIFDVDGLPIQNAKTGLPENIVSTICPTACLNQTLLD